MSCANRAEIVRKATLNCSMNILDGSSRAFVFHILSNEKHRLIEYLRHASLLFAQLHWAIRSKRQMEQFFSSLHLQRRSKSNLRLEEKIDRRFDLVRRSPRPPSVCSCWIDNSTRFSPDRRWKRLDHSVTKRRSWSFTVRRIFPRRSIAISSNPNDNFVRFRRIRCSLKRCPSTDSPRSTWSNIDPNSSVWSSEQVKPTDRSSKSNVRNIFLQGDGRLMTIFINVTLGEKIIYEELALPFNGGSRTIQSINYQRMTSEEDAYVIFVTHPVGSSIVKLIPCETDRRFLCFACWTKTCSIRPIASPRNQTHPTGCSSISISTSTNNNQTRLFSPSSSSSLWSTKTSFSAFYVIVPLTMIIFVLSAIIVVLLFKSRCFSRRQCFQVESADRKTTGSYTNAVLYRPNRNRFRFEKKTCQHVYPVKTDLCPRQDVYSSLSSQSLPSLVIPSNQIQPLAADRFLRSYV